MYNVLHYSINASDRGRVMEKVVNTPSSLFAVIVP